MPYSLALPDRPLRPSTPPSANWGHVKWGQSSVGSAARSCGMIFYRSSTRPYWKRKRSFPSVNTRACHKPSSADSHCGLRPSPVPSVYHFATRTSRRHHLQLFWPGGCQNCVPPSLNLIQTVRWQRIVWSERDTRMPGNTTNDYFESNHPNYGKPTWPDWDREVFRRAFVVDNGPFKRITDRLTIGFSVLVYLPGNCIRAAGDLVSGDKKWQIYGRAETKGDTLAQVWQGPTGLFDFFSAWFGEGHEKPQAIFENLDLLSDGRGSLDQSNEAKTALYYLTECVRSGVVLGLSDIRAGELPEAVRRPFSEEVFLGDIAFDRFQSIVPRSLVDGLFGKGSALPNGASWLLASRLRWTDPIRAVRI